MISKRLIIVFLAPAILIYFGLFLLPVLSTLVFSLYDWSGFTKNMTFIGPKNYVRLWYDPIFWLSLRNTLLILLVGGFLVFALALLFTALVSSGIWGRKLFRYLLYLPNVLPVVAVTAMWGYILNPQVGLLNSALRWVGLASLSKTLWTAPDNIFWSMLAAIVWVNTGFFLILLLAGTDKLPQETLDAAEIDGAGLFQKFFYITIPMIWDVLVISFVVWIIAAVRMFEFPYAFGLIQIPQQLYTLGIYLFVMGFGHREPIFQLGYAAAIGVVLLATAFALIVAARQFLRREALEY
jgi:ABC-type sugar transport system permease subunit